MSSNGKRFDRALSRQKAGDLQGAERLYRAILLDDPRHADALHFLGVIAYQVGRHHDAVQFIARAIAIRPSKASYHCNLGLAYQALSELEQSEQCFQRAIHLRPDNAVAHNNLGVILLEQGRAEDATQCFEQAKRFGSNDPEAYNNLGKSLRAQGKLDQAIANLETALRLKPDFPDAHISLGMVLRDQGKFEEAIKHFQRAAELRPDFAEALNYLGASHSKLQRQAEAEKYLRQAIGLDPKSASALSNLGVTLLEQEQFEEAETCLREALRLKPDFAGARSNLGAVFMQLGEPERALSVLEDALRMQPDLVDAHWNRALAWLTLGRFPEGWLEYEWRWLRPEARKQRKIPRPLWDGSPLEGRTIMLHAEQGLGDTLQFARYVDTVRGLGGNVILACQKPLVPLLKQSLDVDQVIPLGPAQLRFDVHAPLMSLPCLLGTTLKSIPQRIPYIRPDEALVEEWRERLADFDGFRIGIAWQGNPTYRGDRRRSIPLRHFRPLARLPDVRLISLQKGLGAEQIEQVAAEFKVETLENFDEERGAFMDSAAVLPNLDLVVTSDTAIAHLAGALGVPVWMAISTNCDWRWLRNQDTSPWYPTMRLFRQQRTNDWDNVFEQIAAEVQDLREREADPEDLCRRATGCSAAVEEIEVSQKGTEHDSDNRGGRQCGSKATAT